MKHVFFHRLAGAVGLVLNGGSFLRLTLIVCRFNGPRRDRSHLGPRETDASRLLQSRNRLKLSSLRGAGGGGGQKSTAVLSARVKAAAGNSLRQLEFTSVEVDSSAQSFDYWRIISFPTDRLQATMAPLSPPPHPYSPASTGQSLPNLVMC